MTVAAAAAAPLAAAVAIRRETAVSVAINTVLSLAFFLLVFGTTDPVPLWGVGAYAFDLIPQCFMIALMSTLVPGMLLGRKRRAGRVGSLATVSPLPKGTVRRAILLAVAAVVVAVAIGWPLLWLTGLETIGWTVALISKLFLGAAVAALVTPLGLSAELDPR